MNSECKRKKIAIFCRRNCGMALETIRYFQERRKEISLIVIETAERKKSSETERQFQKAHMDFNRYLYPSSTKNILRVIWQASPSKIRVMVRQTFNFIVKDRLRQISREKGIPFAEVARHSSMETKLLLEKNGITYVLLTSSAWLIKEPLLTMDTTKIIYAHCAKLPAHRSLDSLPWSVMENDTIGLTAHFVDKGIDTGPILLFIEVAPRKGDNLITLRQRVNSKKPEIFLKVIQGLHEGYIKAVEQNESEGTHHRPMTVTELKRAEDALQERVEQL